jgi:hypothetical protein
VAVLFPAVLSSTIVAMALSIAPSKHWLGNDGPWSAFNIQIGVSQELVQVLPASSASLTLAVLELGCNGRIDQSTCEDLRGAVLDPSDLATWSNITAANNEPFLNVTFPSEEFYFGEGIPSAVGVTSLNLEWYGSQSVKDLHSLPGQVIAGYAAEKPFLGLLGLSGLPSHPATPDAAYNSPLQTLKNVSAISGLTWAYTAGAQYKTPKSLGSLTFGGYDTSLVNMDEALTGVNFTRDANGNELTLSVKTIKVGDESSNSTGLVAQLDSTLPDIWLPESVCELFEDKFGLQWNETFGMYLVGDEQRRRLQAENTSVSFDLAPGPDSPEAVTITLPYSAFDHEVKYPLAGITDGNTTLHYFPLKRSPNETTGFDIFLGRTFFQEA